MRLCFYKEKGVLAAFIRWWTGAHYAHVELQFASGKHWGAVMSRGSGWLSPSQPDMTLEIGDEPWQELQLLNWCEEECECPYDWRGLFLAQFLNQARSTKDAWFCSEVCVAALIHIGKLPEWLDPCTVSPGRLERIWRYVLAHPTK